LGFMEGNSWRVRYVVDLPIGRAVVSKGNNRTAESESLGKFGSAREYLGGNWRRGLFDGRPIEEEKLGCWEKQSSLRETSVCRGLIWEPVDEA
jgi:hypothetical protein